MKQIAQTDARVASVRSPKSSRWLSGLARWASLVFAVGLLISGKALFGRIPLIGQLAPNLDMRLLLLVGGLGAGAARVWLDHMPLIWNRSVLRLVFVPLLAYAVYCVAANALVWHSAWSGEFFVDLLVLLGTVAVFASFVRSQSDAETVAAILAAAGLGILIWLLIVNPQSPQEQGLPTSVTTFRIELTAFCAAAFLQRSSVGWRRMIFGLVAALVVFGALATGARTSLIVLPMLAAVIAYVLVLQRQWTSLAEGAVAITVGVALFALSGHADRLGDRVEAVSDVSHPFDLATLNTPFDLATLNTVIDPVALAAKIQQSEAYSKICTELLNETQGEPVSALPYSCSSYVALPDSTHRIRMLMRAAEILGAHPMVGAGPGGYALTLVYRPDIAVTYTYPHNLFAEIGARAGFIGLGIIAISLLCLTRLYARAVQNNMDAIYFAGMALVYLVGSMTGGDFYDTRLLWIAAVIVSALPSRTAVLKPTH